MKRTRRSTFIPTLASLVVAAACHGNQQPAATRAPAADSLVLERTLCYGSCPAYRLSIAGNGGVTFTSHNPGDSTGTKTDSIQPAQLAWLLDEATRIGFFALPEVIADDSTLCSLRATDRPTTTVTIFRADSTHKVVDCHGCYAAHDLAVTASIEKLRSFENEIDSVAQSSRWIRPATRR